MAENESERKICKLTVCYLGLLFSTEIPLHHPKNRPKKVTPKITLKIMRSTKTSRPCLFNNNEAATSVTINMYKNKNEISKVISPRCGHKSCHFARVCKRLSLFQLISCIHYIRSYSNNAEHSRLWNFKLVHTSLRIGLDCLCYLAGKS